MNGRRSDRRERGRSNESAERYLFDLQRWALSFGPSAWIADLEPYEVSRVAGVVERLRIDPVESAVHAVVTDGTGRAAARWSLRRPTPQLAVVPGRGVVLRGVTSLGPDGAVMFQEPGFDIVTLENLHE